MRRGRSTIVQEGRVIYPWIAKYMVAERMTCKALAENVGTHEVTMCKKLQGLCEWKKWEIDRILALVGLPYETVFKEGENCA